MKANEAPEKIYLALNIFGDIIKDQWQFHRLRDDDIEYTRTDVLIGKAERYIRSIADGLNRDDDVEAFINEFKKYMKEE